jgi:hypothetical protein
MFSGQNLSTHVHGTVFHSISVRLSPLLIIMKLCLFMLEVGIVFEATFACASVSPDYPCRDSPRIVLRRGCLLYDSIVKNTRRHRHLSERHDAFK